MIIFTTSLKRNVIDRFSFLLQITFGMRSNNVIVVKPEPNTEVFEFTSVDAINEELRIENESEETELITGDLTENDDLISQPFLLKSEIVQIKAEPFLSLKDAQTNTELEPEDESKPQPVKYTVTSSGAIKIKLKDESCNDNKSTRIREIFLDDDHNLEDHETIIRQKRPYSCQFCDKRFPSLSNLERHTRIHTGEKPFACSFCNKCFADESNKRGHERRHHNEAMNKCDKKGKTQVSRKVLPFLCTFCTKKFQSKCNLIRHVRIQTGDKTISVQFLWKMFC